MNQDDYMVTMRLEKRDAQEVCIVVHDGAGYVELFSIEGALLPLAVLKGAHVKNLN